MTTIYAFPIFLFSWIEALVLHSNGLKKNVYRTVLYKDAWISLYRACV